MEVINFDWLFIDHIEVTDSDVIFTWSEFPYFRIRKTSYSLKEVMDWMIDQQDDRRGVSIEFFTESYPELVEEMLCDFHEYHTKTPWQKEINGLNQVIKSLEKIQVRYGKIIDSLQRRIKNQLKFNLKKQEK